MTCNNSYVSTCCTQTPQVWGIPFWALRETTGTARLTPLDRVPFILPLLDGLRGRAAVAGNRTWIACLAGGVWCLGADGLTCRLCNTLHWRGRNGR